MRAVVIGIFSIIFIVITINLFLKLPFVWPDESIYADVAQNILHENRIGTDLWLGIIPGVEKCLCWYPPLLFYLLAGWFKIFGFSIISQRLLSFISACVILIALYLITKYLIKNEKIKIAPWFYTLPILTLMLDFTFLQASRLSRPEIFILAFGSLSLLFFQRFTKISVFLSGLFAGMAFMIHFNGIFFFLSFITYFLITQRLKIIKSVQFYLFVLAFIIPILIWAPTILSYFDIAKLQFGMIWAAKSTPTSENWLKEIFSWRNWQLAVIYSGYFIASIIFLIHLIINKKKEYLLLGLVLSFAWIFSIYNRLLWYFVFPILFVYPAFFLVLFNFIKLPSDAKTPAKKITIIILMLSIATILFFNIQLNIGALSERTGDKFSYQQLTNNVLNIIPDKKTVFLSSVPDLYFGFKENNRENILLEFPGGKQTLEAYAEYLKKADFAVFSGAYDWTFFGNFLPAYLEENQLTTYPIGEPGQNGLYVVKLKPQNERIIP